MSFKHIPRSIRQWTARHALHRPLIPFGALSEPVTTTAPIRADTATPRSTPYDPPQSCEFTIGNHQGIHARPAAAFVRCARSFKSHIEISKSGVIYSAKSILGVLSANLNCGTTFTLLAEGPDAAQAIDGIRRLLLELAQQDPP